ncbi:hypothetical protein [Halothiobacillus sp.]|uniref:hypothetical protein n=1 Tax=Halothiobacillus sp. TaxID=1891311 RepID=UPI002AD3E29B|nr:hypothetical protein [Halothiobacillus sp.]
MAETENNALAKFDKDAFRECFSLAEVAERWTGLTGLTVTEDDLLHWCINGFIGIYFIPGSLPAHFSLYEAHEDGTASLLRTWQVPEEEKKIGFMSPKSLIGAPTEAITNILRNGQWTGGMHRIYSIHDEIEVVPMAFGGNGNLRFRRTHKAWFGKNERSPVPIFTLNRNDLFITKLGRDRFEQEHRINQPGMTAKMPDTSNEETENQRLKRTLAALVFGLSKQTRYKTGDKPNISAIVRLALDGVTPEGGEPPPRYGKSTFTNAINSAMYFSENELDQ